MINQSQPQAIIHVCNVPYVFSHDSNIPTVCSVYFAHFNFCCSLLFLVIFFLSGKQNVNINSDILTFLSDVDKIKDLNWSMYILDCLVKGKLFREQLPTRSFPGSLLFLMFFYVDKFVLEEVRAAREIPILKGWTTAMLSTREKLEVFKGRFGTIRGKKVDVGSSTMGLLKMEKVDSSEMKVQLRVNKEEPDPISTKNEETEQDPKKKCHMELALLSVFKDEQYWQDAAVIEAWDKFSKYQEMMLGLINRKNHNQ
ncbi:uncharacterized protein LOC110736096 [Chenopodium quinoa]|uniref:uncharacterized protein LOC110736096 n=1 Tax=Chenopodium quinoa TaxID=63459 RepID=UPI000B799AAC|nr:uncharacterized protein LOC110736096 [Chenopodium quinoa]